MRSVSCGRPARLQVARRAACVLLAVHASAAQAAGFAGEPGRFWRQREREPVPWRTWGAAAFEQARREGRPLFVLVGGGTFDSCDESAEALVSAAGEVLAHAFVPSAIDAAERPELADFYATAAVALEIDAETTAAGGGGLWAVTTAEGWPYAVGALRADEPYRRAFPGRLAALAAELQREPAMVAARAGAALARLRESQASPPALRPLDDALLERALQGLHEAYDPARGDFGGGRHGPLRLLLARPQSVRVRGLAERALGFLARAPLPDCGPSLLEQALRLQALVRGYTAGGTAELRAAAERLADAALAQRDGSGLFQAGPSDPRLSSGANGAMIAALAHSGRALGRPGDLAAAERAAQALVEQAGPPGAWKRLLGPAAVAGEPRGAALLADHALAAEGLLALDQALREGGADYGGRWRRTAAELVAASLGRFADPRGGFFDTDSAHEPLPVRPRSGYDGRGLSGNGLLAGVLLELAQATGEERYARLAEALVEAFLGDLQRAPRGLETLAAAAARRLTERDARSPGPGPAPASPGARATRGALTARLELPLSRLRPGARFEARVDLELPPGRSLNAHRPGARELSGLSVSVPTPEVRAEPPLYPVPTPVRRRFQAEPVPAYVGHARVRLPLVLSRAAAAGTLELRVRLAFQVCDARECAAPDSLLLAAPLEVLGP